MTPLLQIRLLGAFQLTYDQRPVTTVNSTRLQALLAYLVLHADTSHPRQYLSFLLWPDSTEAQARTNLRKLCFQLRQALPDPDLFLRMDNRTIQWKPDAPYTLDVDELRHLLKSLAQEPSSASLNYQATPSQPPPTWGRSRDGSLPNLGPGGAPAREGLVVTANLTQLVDLYVGELLPGCYDDWLLPLRQQLHDQVMGALHRLVTLLENQRAYSDGIRYVRRLLHFDPLQERTYQQLIRLHALNGERSSALRAYHDCLMMLKRDLGVEPEEATTTLYEEILTGRLAAPQSAAAGSDLPPTPPPMPTAPRAKPEFPAFLGAQTPTNTAPSALFVARERELAQLDRCLASVLQGHGQVVFVAGEAGAGKTALVQAFARRAQQIYPGLVVAFGACHTHAGIGDPYLPFRDVLNTLAGDVEAPYASGAITRQNARRLWSLTALTAQFLADHGPNLIDTFVPGHPLLARLAHFACAPEWLARLAQLCAQPNHADLVQSRLFAQYTSVLQALAAHHPIVLLLEDLHWADTSSISLLFHLGSSIVTHPILLVGTYRAEEITLGDAPRPLEEVVNEFRRRHGEIRVQLNATVEGEGRHFVDALLDTEPNRLDTTFRQALYRHTGGHALFTVELLRHLQERGGLVQDQAGRWIEGNSVNWTTLPAKAEGVIEKRIRRLGDSTREILAIASVEGETFTAEVVARVQELSERAMLRELTHLAERHRLVRAQEEVKIAQRYLSRYRFTHALFQHYLYQNLSTGERRLLHGAIANALETLYGEQTVAITPQLAYHYAQAGAEEKAVAYLTQAGDWARRLSASQEALNYYQQALTLTEGKEAYDAILARRAQVLLHLFQGQAAVHDYEQLLASAQQRLNRQQELTALTGLAQAYYVVALDALDSDAISRVGPLRDAAYALARELGDKRAMVRALLVARWLVDSGQSSKEQALAQAEEAVALSQEVDSDQLILESNTSLIFALRLLERHAEAEAQGEALLSRPEAQRNLPLRKDIYYELMWVHYFRGNYARCIVCCDDGIQIAHAIGAPPVQYPTIKALALLWLGRYADAWRSLQEEVADEAHQLGGAFQALGIGLYYLELMAYTKASVVFTQVVAQAKRLRRVWLENWSMALLVKAMIRGGQFEEGQLLVMRQDLIHVVDESVESMIVGLAVMELGEIAFAASQLDEALQHTENLEHTAQRLGLCHDHLAAVELRTRILLQMGKGAEVLALADMGIRRAESMNYLSLAWRLRATKAQALAKQGQHPMAKLEYQAAAAVIKTLAAALNDAELRQGFLDDPLVGSIMAAAQV